MTPAALVANEKLSEAESPEDATSAACEANVNDSLNLLDPMTFNFTGDICSDIKFWLQGTERSTEDLHGPGHNPKVGRENIWNAMITKALHPSDPLSRCKQAIDAVDSEVEALRSRHVWDEANVMEFEKAAAEWPDADFADLFSIVGIKNFESADVSLRKWKGRVVLGGHAVKKATGEKAIFIARSFGRYAA